MQRIKKLFLVLTVTLSLVLTCKGSLACPNCKEAVAAQPKEAGELANGYNWSVLFMIAMPFTLLGTGVFLVKRAAANGSFPQL
jgi:hypothetical protein